MNDRIRSRVRRVDDVGRLGADVLIVWSECTRDDAVRSTLRVARAFASADDWTELAPRVVEFPVAGVTRDALLDAIDEPAAALPAGDSGAARSRDLRAELARPA